MIDHEMTLEDLETLFWNCSQDTDFVANIFWEQFSRQQILSIKNYN